MTVRKPLIASPAWTAEEDETLCSMLAEGKTVAEVAIALQRTCGAIYARAKRLIDSDGGKSIQPVRLPRCRFELSSTKPSGPR